MLSFLYTEIDLLCTIVTVIMLVNIHPKRMGKTTLDQTLFQWLLITNIVILVLDASIWLLGGRHFIYAPVLHKFVTVLYYIFNPFVCFIWLLYSQFKIDQQPEKTKRLAKLCLFPILVNAVLSLSSLGTGWLFYIDGNNIYHRGKFFILMPVICLTYFVFAFILLMKHFKKPKSNSRTNQWYFYMLLFPVISFIGTAIQSFFYGLSLIWVSTTIALLLVFIHIQNTQIGLDALTELYNRRSLDNYLTQKVKNINRAEEIFLIILDVDRFKEINDRYGHIIGDEALIQTGNILRSSCHIRQDFLARMGGDEFAIVGTCHHQEYIPQILAKISYYAKEFNQNSSSYTLSFSLGSAFLSECDFPTVDNFVRIADARMYAEKNHKRSYVSS